MLPLDYDSSAVAIDSNWMAERQLIEIGVVTQLAFTLLVDVALVESTAAGRATPGGNFKTSVCEGI